MKKRLLGIYVLLAFVAPVLAQQFKWVPFKEPNLKFAVIFPDDPTRNPPDVKKRADGSAESTGYYFAASSPGIYVALTGVTDYDFAVDAERELIADRDNFVSALDLKVTNNRRYEFQSGDEKLPALAFGMEDPTRIGKAIVIVRGNRSYMAAFLYRKNQDYAAAADKYLTSFEITK